MYEKNIKLNIHANIWSYFVAARSDWYRLLFLSIETYWNISNSNVVFVIHYSNFWLFLGNVNCIWNFANARERISLQLHREPWLIGIIFPFFLSFLLYRFNVEKLIEYFCLVISLLFKWHYKCEKILKVMKIVSLYCVTGTCTRYSIDWFQRWVIKWLTSYIEPQIPL